MPHRLSANEFQALLRRTFEALFGNARDSDDSAQRVVWLEGRGLDGVGVLLRALDRLERNYAQGPDIAEGGQPGYWTVQPDGESLISLAGPLSDIAIARAVESGRCRLEIAGPCDGEMILPSMARFAANGLNASLQWAGYDGAVHSAWIRCGDAEPEYRIDPPDTLAADRVTGLVLNCGNRPPDAAVAGRHGNTSGHHATPAGLQELWIASIDDGIEADTGSIAQLGRIADRVLVEASETSRRGAGE